MKEPILRLEPVVLHLSLVPALQLVVSQELLLRAQPVPGLLAVLMVSLQRAY